MQQHEKLLEQIAALQKQADELHQAERQKAIDKALSLISQYEITVKELKFTGKTARSKKAVAVKYKDNAGNTWTGRGRTPFWMAAAEAVGKKRESFLVA